MTGLEPAPEAETVFGPPWRTPAGPNEPIRVTEPGIYWLTAEEYHDPAVTGAWMSNSDGRALIGDGCPAQFKHDRDHGIRKISRAYDFGHAAHTLILGRGEQFAVFEPKKLDGRTVAGKAQAVEVAAARAAGLTPIYGDEWQTIQAMAAVALEHPAAAELLAQPGRPEACLFWREPLPLDGGLVTVQRRAMVDFLPDVPADEGTPMRVVDYKTAAEVAPDDGMDRRIYDHGHHRQAATIVDGVWELFGRDSEVIFLHQRKTAPYLVTPVALDTVAMNAGRIENRYALEVWARCWRDDHWPDFTDGQIVLRTIPAYISRQFEDEVVI